MAWVMKELPSKHGHNQPADLMSTTQEQGQEFVARTHYKQLRVQKSLNNPRVYNKKSDFILVGDEFLSPSARMKMANYR